MSKPVAQFYQFMQGYADFMDEMAISEDKKYQALISGEAARLDKAIAELQANIMRLNKLEEQRETIQAESGFGGLLFREIIDKLESGDRSAFMALFERISRTVALIQNSNQKSMSFAELSLHINDMKINNTHQTANYSPTGERIDNENSGTVFQTKI